MTSVANASILPPLTPPQIAAAFAVFAIAVIVMRAWKLGLERNLIASALRLIAQLLFAGLLLKFVIEEKAMSLTVSAIVATTMVVAAGLAAVPGRPFGQWRLTVLTMVTLLFVGGGTTFYTVLVVVGPAPWNAPRFTLTILALVLATSATIVNVSLRILLKSVERDRTVIETRLALGHTGRRALAGVAREAMNAGLAPLLLLFSLGSLTSFPGLMGGQVMAGADPIEAAKYQLALVFVTAGAATFSASVATMGAVLMLTDRRHRLRK